MKCLFLLLMCVSVNGCVKVSKALASHTPNHPTSCVRVDSNLSLLRVYRCESDEVICYRTGSSDGGLSCKWKTGDWRSE